MGINGKTFEHKSISELVDIVRDDFRRFDAEGLIDEGKFIKTVQYCNEKLGMQVREVREIAIEVNEFQAELPADLEKIFYVAALRCSNTHTVIGRNPFDNNFDQDVIYEACLNRERLGCAQNYQVIIKREGIVQTYDYNNWTQLGISASSDKYCHIDSPNRKARGKYEITIRDGKIETPFRTGIIYIMYLGTMMDVDGNVTFPFHPMITPYYEWMIKEKILSDAIFNSDMSNIGELYKEAKLERAKAWLDAYNFTTERGYADFVKDNKKRELAFYNEYFKHFQ